ncbi:MAG TPA: FxLYD domain-containing protein [Verrucomicrobiae bacterium]|nr:FxLYD domain-containing protein [Verrucomicrobiae bacterium]
MSKTKYLKGACQHCGGHLEFLADHIGMVVPCPHCQQETELNLLPPAETPTVPRRALVWTGIAVIILILGFGAALVALKRAQRWAERQKNQTAVPASFPMVEGPGNPVPEPAETNSASLNELSASSVTLEKTPGSSLVYAVGMIRNTSTRQRFGIKIELELADAAGQKVGTASDYHPLLEPGAQWQFKALVVQAKAVSAKITSIREDQ